MTSVKMPTSRMESIGKSSLVKGDFVTDCQNVDRKQASFLSIMSMQSKETLNYSENAITKTTKGTNLETDPSRKSNSDSTKKCATNDMTVNTKESLEKKEQVVDENGESLTETKKKTDVEDNLNSNGLQDEAQGYLQSFLNQLQKILGVTKEELNELMQETGLTVTELLDTNNLQTLILTHFNADNVADALVNEPLANALQEGLEAVNLLKEQMSQLTGMDALKITNEMVEAILKDDNTKAYMAKTAVDGNGKQPEAKEDLVANTTAKEVTVIVQKETSTSSNQAGGENLENQDSRSEQNRHNETQTDFVDYFSSKVTQVDSVNSVVEPVSVRHIITQIVDQIKLTINQSQTSMQLQLNPENLGHVELLVSQKEGVMTAHFTVQNQVAKEALESSLNILKQNFEEQGLKVSDVEVTIGNYSEGFGRDAENGQASGKGFGNRKTGFHGFDLSEESSDTMVSQPERTNYNGTVDYTA